ncbi:MAG: SDR family oxidoreductase [Bacteroidales bacterium]|nr:SDR family oxidoreductase [Bacteroidales bacterium]
MLKGKNAIITGAGSGIGLATLHLFAENGCNCWAIVHRNDDGFKREIHRIESGCGVWVKPILIDLGHSDSINEGMKAVLKEKVPIDILVNAAGIVSPSRLFSMTKMEDVRKVMDVNFFGALELTQFVLRPMMRKKKGSIINIASVSAWGEDASQIEYAASKAALIVATKKLAKELGGTGIRVNAVAPGFIRTKMLKSLLDEDTAEKIQKELGLHRFGNPEEIAEVCLFLASEKSSYMTGETIKVDGGGINVRFPIPK